MQAPRSKPVGGLLLGLFLGFLLGLATAAAIAVYLLKTPMPFTNKAKPPEKASPATQPLAEVAKPVKPEEGKPRFDFYRILPGHEEPVTSEQLKQAAQAQAKSGAPSPDLYLLQVGAFQNPADADNLKAKLALIGLEANVEPTNLAEKGFWYRVRVGPYSNVDEINRARSLLLQNGVDASLVKIRDAAPTAPKNQQNPQNPQNPQNQ